MNVSSVMAVGLIVVGMLGPRAALCAEDAGSGQHNIFAGCDSDARAPSEASPRDRVHQRAGATVDRITQRAFASFSMDDLDRGVPDQMAKLCWARLDGVWRETGQVSLDRSIDVDDTWGSDVPELTTMAIGTYTTPGYLVIAAGSDSERVLRLKNGLTGDAEVEFRSNDGVSLTDVLRRGGKTKTYRASARFDYGQELVLDVTRTGRVRITIGDASFLRPSPGVSRATMASQIAADDSFLLNYNLDNLAASRRGYDIVTQDPFFLLQNTKAEVFAKVDPKKYYITERRTVPIGLSLVQEVSQGAVYRKSLASSEREIQQTVQHAFGANLQGAGVMGGVPVAASAGFDASRSAMNGMRQSQSVAQAIAFSRSKQYALVVDHPYITLSDAFVDAVEDARRHGRYETLIERFGTHFAYAVTYGAAAKVTQSFTEKSYTERASRDVGFGVNGGASVFGIGGSAHVSKLTGKSTSTSGTIGNEGATFVAVGGNGSWDQNGYSAGTTPYPILLDLRLLHELLNPMNFPGEPEIYVTVRRNLERAVSTYLAQYASSLSAESLLPEIVPVASSPALRVSTRTFKNPKFQGKWLDMCLARGSCREQRAVDAFCRHQKYDRATSRSASKVVMMHQTIRIGDQSLCTNVANNCRRIGSVTCERRR